MKFAAVSKAKHAGFGYEFKVEVFAAWDTIPLSSAELYKVLSWGVVAFKKLGGQYQLCLLSGLVKGRNVYVHPGSKKLVMPYVPAAMRAYPFRLVERDGQKVLTVLENESGFNAQAANKLLDAEGEMTGHSRQLMLFLDKLSQTADQDCDALAKIASLGLLKPFVIRAKDPHGGEDQVLRDDLFVIDETLLQTVTDEQAGVLCRSGGLALVSSQLQSMANWGVFNRFCEASVKQLSKQDEAMPDLDAFFDGDDDTLKF